MCAIASARIITHKGDLLFPNAGLGVVGDGFGFSFFPKNMDIEGLLGTLGDALSAVENALEIP